MFSQELKIPKKRVAVLIGKKGEIKRLLERKTKTRIQVSKEGEVIVSSEDNINCYNAIPMILAIGRGFNPEVAVLLLDETFTFEMISMKEFCKNEKAMLRTRSRIIGTNGKARRMLEKLTDTFISVYGKTISLIGKFEDVAIAKIAIQKLLQGAPHGNAYKYIERERKKHLMEK